MLSPMRISEDAAGLALSYPLWIGVAFALLAAVAVGFASMARRRPRRLWPLVAAALIASWAGVYFTTFSTTITADSGRVYGFLRYDDSVLWRDATDIYLERRGGEWTIVVQDRHGLAHDFDVGDLGIEERDRVMTYMVDRMPQSAFRPDTALLKREGGGARPVSLFSDQQI
jgi:hypothetical protein